MTSKSPKYRIKLDFTNEKPLPGYVGKGVKEISLIIERYNLQMIKAECYINPPKGQASRMRITFKGGEIMDVEDDETEDVAEWCRDNTMETPAQPFTGPSSRRASKATK